MPERARTSQVQVAAQGRTVMVDAPPGTTVAQFGLLVADRTGLPLGAFGLYREGRPLRSLEGPCTIELKTRGRGGCFKEAIMCAIGSLGFLISRSAISSPPPPSRPFPSVIRLEIQSTRRLPRLCLQCSNVV